MAYNSRKKTSVKPRQRLQRAERWEQIIAVSAELFSSKGYHGASLDEIGQQVGIQKAALYHYVSSKEDILLEIFDRMLSKAESEVLPIASEPFLPDERLRRMVNRYVELMLADAAMWSLIHYQQNALPPEIYNSTLRRYRLFERKFEDIIKEGQEIGQFKPMPARLLALSLFGMCNYVYHWINFVRFDKEEIVGVISEVLERGLMDDGTHRVGTWPRFSDASEAMARTESGLTAIQEQLSELQVTFQRERNRLLDGLANAGTADPARETRRMS